MVSARRGRPRFARFYAWASPIARERRGTAPRCWPILGVIEVIPR